LGLGRDARQPLLLELAPLGQVARHLGEADQPTLTVEDARDDDVGPEAPAVLAEAPAQVLEATVARRDLELELALARANVLLGVEGREVLADDLVGAPALDPLGGGVPGLDVPGRVEHEDGVVGRALDEQAEPLLALAEPLDHLRWYRLVWSPGDHEPG